MRWLNLILSASCILLEACHPSASIPPKPAAQSTQIAAVEIGGRDVVRLTRQAKSGSSKPEFLSVTLLPGRGMNMLQVTANLPGRGEVPLLHSPSLAEAANLLSGSDKDALGNASFSFGGAFLVPYPNRIAGEASSDGKLVITHWHGHTLALPANTPSKTSGGQVVAMHGLISQAKVDDVHTQATADGETVTGIVHAGDFGGHWIANTDLDFSIALTGDAIDIAITARNIGKEPEPMSIGWHPYFQIPSGHRMQARLQMPASMMAPVINRGDVLPAGVLKPVKGTEYDYGAAGGVSLDDHFLDDSFTHLQRTNGAVEVKLIDPEAKYGLMLSALSPEIRAVQAYSPKNSSFLAIEPQFNLVDPFGKEWKGMETGMVTLRPGQSVTWRVRLTLFQP